MRVTLVLCLLLAFGTPAAADSCNDLDEATGIGIKSHWPDAVFVIYRGLDSDAIESGLRNIGASIADADRDFVVITRPGWPKIRVVGFVDGCYEAFVDVRRETLDAWLAKIAG